MRRMFQSLDLLVLSFLFLRTTSETGSVLPPQNLSPLWIDFYPGLTWEPPQQPMTGCTYLVTRKTKADNGPWVVNNYTNTSMVDKRFMEGGSMHWSVRTVCDGVESKAMVYDFDYPELVTDFQCYMISAADAQCSWTPAHHVPHVKFFYRLKNGGDGSLSKLQECSSYGYTNGRKICDLKVSIDDFVHILFNATQNNTSVRNTFRRAVIDNVKPPPPNVAVKKIGDKLNITWNAPDFLGLSDWTFKINTVCGIEKEEGRLGETSYQLIRVPHCQYCVAVKTVAETTTGESPWSNKTCVDADKDPNASVYAAIFIPLITACLALFIFVCCRKNRRNIFPKVPKPRDLLSDISDNNNKGKVQDLYVPAEEEENCKITVVVDSQINKLDC